MDAFHWLQVLFLVLFTATAFGITTIMEENETEKPIEPSEPVEQKNESTAAKKIYDACESLKSKLLAKNSDYGESIFSSPLLVNVSAEDAIAVRASDKIKRLEHLFKKQATTKVSDESLDDTIQDLAGYCILWLIARKSEQ